MSIGGIESIGFQPLATPALDSAGGASAPTKGGDGGFGKILVDGVERLQDVQSKSDSLAVEAATGDLDSIHRYTVAASEASITTQLTVAMRNRAVEAFTEIMRMPV